MLIGCARVWKADGNQLLDLQSDALVRADVKAKRIYGDEASGRKDHRPGLETCLKTLQPGNTFVVCKLDRLGRDLKHLMNTVDDLRGREVGFRVLAGAGADIDTTTANGAWCSGSLYPWRSLSATSSPSAPGRAWAARARGRLGGRPRRMDRAMLKMAMSAMAAREAKAQDLARRPGIKTTTLHMYVHGDGTPKEPGQTLLERENPAAAI